MEEHQHTLHRNITMPNASPEPLDHPEFTNPLGKHQKDKNHDDALAPEEKRVAKTLIIAIIATIVFIPIIAASSESPLINVGIGLLPLLATFIIDLILTYQHYKVVTFWIVIALAHIAGIGLIYGANMLLQEPIHLAGSISTSTVIAIIVTAVLMFVDAKRTGAHAQHIVHKKNIVEFRPEKIDEYVHSIEDKAKAINFTIGRVYRASNGGTVAMRDRIKIPSEWYNEFHHTSSTEENSAEQLASAGVLVRKIRDRLALLSKEEQEVFSAHERKEIKNLVRSADGKDTIITILKANDKDPVDHYYVAACDFCDRILEEIEKK